MLPLLLTARLRTTKATGIFMKITLENQVDDLLDKFEDYYKGKSKHRGKMKDLPVPTTWC